nr:DUF896 domain-containing protein [Haloplasma contractile]
MNTKLIKRINELARKDKEDGLTTEEKREQEQLRSDYLKQFRNRFRNQVETITVIDEEGNDVTPKKLKQIKNKKDPTIM